MATQPQTNLTVVQEGQVRLLRPGLRRLLYVSGALVLIIGAQLYVLTDHTNRAFAWTIHPGLTAAFLGAALFIAPKATGPIWPWTLTPLTGRAVGAWLLGLGVAAAGSMLERDLDRLRPTMVAFALFGGLELIALARYAGDVDWGGPAG